MQFCRACVAMAGVMAVFVLAACSGGGNGGDGSADGLSGASIRLEPATAAQPDPFVVPNLDSALAAGEAISVAASDPPTVRDKVASALSGKTTTGTEPGLYGGSLDVAICDVEQLVAFHTDPANAPVTAAFAEVQGIAPEQVVTFIRELTPVRLRFDTRVTNHGYSGGRATPIQAVLQAGTAVLVDDTGVPRVKCFCGNPLLEPEAVHGVDDAEALDVDALAANPGARWEDFDPDNVVTISPGPPTDALVVTDLMTGERFELPVGPGSTTTTPPTAPPPTTTPPTSTTPPTTAPTTTAPSPTTTTGSGGPGTGGTPGTRCVHRPDSIICYSN